MKVKIEYQSKDDGKFWYPKRIIKEKEMFLLCPYSNDNCGSWCPMLDISQDESYCIWNCHNTKAIIVYEVR